MSERTDATAVLDRFHAALLIWHEREREAHAQRVGMKAELAALLAVGTPERAPPSYARCLFCNHEYGYEGRGRYEAISAPCGCKGIGWKCSIGESYHIDNEFKCFGCGEHYMQKCYSCRQ